MLPARRLCMMWAMDGLPNPGCHSLILAALPAGERKVLTAELEHVALGFGETLEWADELVKYAWFPTTAVASSISRATEGGAVELATTGREGFVGIAALLGDSRATYETVVQIPGDGFRLPVGTFKQMVRVLPSLQPLLLRYTLALITQIAQGVACNRLHPVEARCARWLLLSHDRVDGDRFQLTQEYLGLMLGVARPSVSVAAGMLQKAGYIRYVRGAMHIVDRAGLESASCACYKVIRNDYRRLLSAS